MSTRKPGRPAKKITYVDVPYEGKDYVVGIIDAIGSDDPIVFVIDKEDESSVVSRNWHKCSVNYISSSMKDKYGEPCQMFLHNLIMGKLTFDGKGQLETVDHISRNGFDNRKENLRIVTQSQQNINQRKRPRTATLPADCGFTMEDVPRHIWYIKASGAHGDRFTIEFKSEGITWKTSSSKKRTLRQKLDEALVKLSEFYAIYPHLDPENNTKIDQEIFLNESFRLIVNNAKHSAGIASTEENYITHV